jgi:hypothetical protein
LETELAEGKGVPVRRIDFQGLAKTPIRDFNQQNTLRQAGYGKAHNIISAWSRKLQPDPFELVLSNEKQLL